MKKLLLASAVVMGLVSANAMADVFHTKKHNIRITCVNDNNCTYQSWNKPKRIGQGSPDLEIRHGTRGQCARSICYDFVQGNTEINVYDGVNDSESGVVVSVNGRTKGNYRFVY